MKRLRFQTGASFCFMFYIFFFCSSPLYTDLVIVVGCGGTIINAFIDSIKNEELLERDLQADKWRERVKKNEGRMILFVMIYKYDSFFQSLFFCFVGNFNGIGKVQFSVV